MSRAPVSREGTPVCRYSELVVDDEFWDAVTVTDAHVLLTAAVFKDPGPNHINALQAANNRFGERIAHGPLLMGIMDGALGNVLGSTIVALLEQSARFRRPTRFGDTVICHWRVTELTDKPDAFDGGGVVRLEGEAFNQGAEVLAEMTIVLAVADRPLWTASQHIAAARGSEPEDRPPDHGA